MNKLAYRIGGLLYMPALQVNISDKIINKEIPYLTSVAFCLEDAIQDDALIEAENSLYDILYKLKDAADLPYIFIRVRSPQHLEKILGYYSEVKDIITGYILPKYESSVADAYIRIVRENRIHIMPILESAAVADISSRHKELSLIKAGLDSIREKVINVRVGGNDLSSLYGLKCPINYTVYDLAVIRDILIDILNVFAKDYVVSGPVFNYFADNGTVKWLDSFQKELELDKLNGFIGKTVIHPCQLPYVYEMLKVDKDDFADAKKLLLWQEASVGVAKNSSGTGMNEVKCHLNWAKKIYNLGNIYGIKGE